MHDTGRGAWGHLPVHGEDRAPARRDADGGSHLRRHNFMILGSPPESTAAKGHPTAQRGACEPQVCMCVDVHCVHVLVCVSMRTCAGYSCVLMRTHVSCMFLCLYMCACSCV